MSSGGNDWNHQSGDSLDDNDNDSLPPPPSLSFSSLSLPVGLPKPPPFLSKTTSNTTTTTSATISNDHSSNNQENYSEAASTTLPKLSSNLMPLPPPPVPPPPSFPLPVPHPLKQASITNNNDNPTLILPSTTTSDDKPTLLVETDILPPPPPPPPPHHTISSLLDTTLLTTLESAPNSNNFTSLSAASTMIMKNNQNQNQYQYQQYHDRIEKVVVKEEEEPMKIPRIPKRNTKTLIQPNYYQKQTNNHHNNNKNDISKKSFLSPTLTSIQQSIPILIISTTTTQEMIYTKNSLSISELFTGIANSIGVMNMTGTTNNASGSSGSSVTSTSSNGGGGNNNNGIRLPPLRSINGKSIQMKWDDVQFIFYNGNELDYGVGCNNDDINNNDDNSNDDFDNSNDYYKNNEQMLHSAAREDWSCIADDDNDIDDQNNNDNENIFGFHRHHHNGKGLSVQDIEYHIERIIQKDHHLDNHHQNFHNNNHNANDHNTNHKSQNGELKSWTELHESNEKVPEDLTLHQQSHNASQAYDTLIADTNHTPWLLRFRYALNNIASSSCLSTQQLKGGGGGVGGGDGKKEKVPYYDSMLSCPAVILYIASSNDVNPIEALMEMKNSNMHLPNACKNGFYDVNTMRKFYLVLHDEVDGDVEFDEDKVLSQMNARFGQKSSHMSSSSSSSTSGVGGGSSCNCCAVIRLNSVPLDVAKSNISMEDPIWDRFIHNKQWPVSLTKCMQDKLKIRGVCLSSRDKSSLRKFIAQMVAMCVIPSLERRINNMNVEVTNAKKGVKNVFKSFWRKPKESGSLSGSVHGSIHGDNFSSTSGTGHANHGFNGGGGGSSNNVFYRYDAIESQTRLLADTLFLVKDFESALSMYRLVKDDYKHDNNMFHTASTYEMMALCLYLSDWQGDREKRDIIHYLESAMDLYAAAADEDPLSQNVDRHRPNVAGVATRSVTRLALMLSSSPSLSDEHHMEVAKLLGNASSQETPLGGAILLEQSSSHYFRAGMYRKFAHHILMAGHLFRSAGQDQHALRCFASSMYIYHGSDRVWMDLYDHVMSALAVQLYSMNRMELSFELYATLVATTGNGRVSVKSQQKFLENLLRICRGFENDTLNGIEKMKFMSKSKKLKEEGDQVLHDTPGSYRVLEVHDINIPHIHDGSISVETSQLASFSDSIQFGTPSQGLEAIWQEMMNSTEAELNAMSEYNNFDYQSLPSSKILTEKVISKLDEEYAKAIFAAKSKKNLSLNPIVRAKMEPITVSFTISNPLGFLVPISSLQLVARMKCKTTGRVCTNAEAINIPSKDKKKSHDKKWKFYSSNEEFVVADFSRLSASIEDSNKTWIAQCDHEGEPLFVVTKKAIAMDGMSKRVVRLSLCPMVMGDLEIIGVRCKIFNEIWVYHTFSVLGPILQNNASNRGQRGEFILATTLISHFFFCDSDLTI